MSVIKFGEYYSHERLLEIYKRLIRKYSPYLKGSIIGSSFDQRDIFMMKLGYGEKGIICCGGVHGRESVNPIVLMKMVETYCEGIIHNYSLGNYNLRELFNEYSIYFIPLLNPDGYMIAMNGFACMLNKKLRDHIACMGIPFAEWKYNGRGVDINRNFPAISWKSSFKDDQPASEPETVALIHVFDTVSSVGFLDYHSRGDVIYYHRGDMSKNYNTRQLELAECLSGVTNYTLVPPDEELENGEIGGNTVHYYSEFIGNPAITIETLPDEEEFPLNNVLQSNVYDRVLLTPLAFMSKL